MTFINKVYIIHNLQLFKFPIRCIGTKYVAIKYLFFNIVQLLFFSPLFNYIHTYLYFFLSTLQNSPFFQRYEINLKEAILGDGSFSVCRRCVDRTTGTEYAVKIVSKRVDCSSEIRLLKQCQGHPNVVQLIDILQVSLQLQKVQKTYFKMDIFIDSSKIPITFFCIFLDL